MKEKKMYKHNALSRKELVKIFAGTGKNDPPVHNNPGTGADSPGCNGNCQELNNCINNHYRICISESGILEDEDRCMKMAILSCNTTI